MEYSCKYDQSVHRQLVQTSIRHFCEEQPDLVLISEDGEEMKTTKRFISLFTTLVWRVCSDSGSPEEACVSVPFPRHTLVLLMEFLRTGYVGSQEKDELLLLRELIRSLDINDENFELEKLLPPKKEKPKKFKQRSKKNLKVQNVEIPVLELLECFSEQEDADVLDSKCKEEKIVKQEKFVDKGNASEHGKYVCRVCEKEFKNGSQLKQHKVTHTKEKNFVCIECGKRFGTAAILYNHQGVHNPLQCKFCDFKVAQNAGLVSHMKKRHAQ